MTEALARNTDPATSHEAAAAVDTTRLETIVLGALRDHGPMTTTEISARIGLDLWCVSPRMRPLATKGKVEERGSRVPEGKKRGSIVWAAT